MQIFAGFYKQLLDHLSEGVYFVDTERRILYWNRGAEVISGYSAEEVLNTRCIDGIFDHVDERMQPLCRHGCPLMKSLQTGEAIEERLFLRHRDGHRVPVDAKVAPLRDEKGRIAGAVEVFADATALVQVERLNADLQKLVHIDPLTRIPNRRALMQALNREYQRFRRYGTPFSVLFVDIDHFKRVNDTCGHRVGDQALQWLARKLRRSLRRTDLVARFGGEEFVLLLASTDAATAERIGEHLRGEIAEGPCPATESTLTASFGVASARPEDTVGSLLDRADAALYISKREGRNRVTRL